MTPRPPAQEDPMNPAADDAVLERAVATVTAASAERDPGPEPDPEPEAVR